MKHPRTYNLRNLATLLGISLIAAAELTLFSGCKGNPTSAASIERVVGKPPTVTASPVSADLRHADPLSSSLWKNAQWVNFSAPANTTRSTAPSRAALLFDSSTLYIAYVNTLQPTTPAGTSVDAVSIYLDTTAAADGRDIIQISVDSTGRTNCTWIRGATLAQPRDDGSPDLGHPISEFPGMTVKGIWTDITETTDLGQPAWVAVVAVPLSTLPLPLQTTATAGTRWKFNLVRTVTSFDGDGPGKRRIGQLQSNLSPIYVDAQALSPYRMAELDLINNP